MILRTKWLGKVEGKQVKKLSMMRTLGIGGLRVDEF
jgi:hypothetical protein